MFCLRDNIKNQRVEESAALTSASLNARRVVALAIDWWHIPHLSEQELALITSCALSIKILSLGIDLLKEIASFLYAGYGKSSLPLPLESRITFTLFKSLRAYNAHSTEATRIPSEQIEQQQAPFDLAITRSAAILDAAIYSASAKLTNPGIEQQLALVVWFGEHKQKEDLLHYLVGETFVAKEQALDAKYRRYLHFIQAHYSAWIQEPTVSSAIKARYHALIPISTLDSIFKGIFGIFYSKPESNLVTSSIKLNFIPLS